MRNERRIRNRPRRGEGAMYRVLQRQEVRYGQFKEFVDLIAEVNALLRDRGLAQFKAWTPTVGRGNEIVLETEYPDLAAFARESETFSSDPELMKVWRTGAELVVQGSLVTEMLEPAPDLA